MESEIELKSEESEINQEDRVLGHKSELLTALRLNIPGFIFAILNAFQDTIDLYFVKKGFDTRGVAIVSICSNIRTLVLGISAFTMQGSTRKFSDYVAQSKWTEFGKLFVEMVRFNLIFGIILTAILIFAVPHLVVRMGVPEEYKKDAQMYLLPITLIPVFVSNMISIAGVFTATGRAMLGAVTQMIALATTIGMDALFIFVLKANIMWIGVAFCVGPVIISVVLFILIAAHKFKNINPVWKSFLEKPTKDFWELIKYCLPLATTIGLGVFSPIVFSVLLTKVSGENATNISTVYSTTMKVFLLYAAAVAGGIGGLIPSATYAMHKRNGKRIALLTFWSALLPMMIAVAVESTMIIVPQSILKIWIHDEKMLAYVPRLSRIPFYTIVIEPIVLILLSLSMIFGFGALSAVPPIFKAFGFFGAAFGLFNKAKEDPVILAYAHTVQDSVNLIVTLIIFICSYVYYRKNEYASDATMQAPLIE